mgnify:FL=1
MIEPFIGSEALASGSVTRHQLRTKFTAIHHDVYMPVDSELTPAVRAKAGWLRSRRRGVLAGFSASALHGAKWISATRPAEIFDSNRRPTAQVLVRSGQVATDEIWLRDGIKLTSPARTALDLLCWNPVDAAIAATDALARATRLKLADVQSLIERYAGRREIRRAREALKLVDPGSESPRETWLRLLLVRAGFPTPETQIVVRNEYGVVIAVVDMGWEHLRLGLEYEGDHHRTNRRQFNRDIHRYEELREMGWLIIRVTVEDVAGSIIHRVGAELARRQ